MGSKRTYGLAMGYGPNVLPTRVPDRRSQTLAVLSLEETAKLRPSGENENEAISPVATWIGGAGLPAGARVEQQDLSAFCTDAEELRAGRDVERAGVQAVAQVEQPPATANIPRDQH